MAAQPAGTAARPPQSPQSCEHTSLSTFFPACPTLAPADTHPTMEQNPSPNPNPTSNPTSPPDPQHHPSDPQHQKTGSGVLGGRRKQAKPQRKTGEGRSAEEKKRESVRRAAPAPLCRLLVSGCLLARASKPVKKSPDRSTPTTDNTLQHFATHRLSNTGPDQGCPTRIANFTELKPPQKEEVTQFQNTNK